MLTVVVFLLVLGFLVFIHEFGHFILAKRAGVRVEAFAFGFGPRLIGWKRGDTDYRICPIPLGGYVKMLGEDPSEEGADQRDSYAQKSVWTRVKIVTAGPLMNLLLPFLLMPLVYMIGIQEPAYLDKPPVVGWVDRDSPGETAGFQAGDRIVRIEGEAVPDWESAKILFASNPDKTLAVDVVRDEREVPLRITPESDGYRGGVTGLVQEIPPVVGALSPDMPAQQAGLREGDRILSINGEPVHEWAQMSAIIRGSPEEPLTLEVRRGADTLTFVVTPVLDEEIEGGMLGIAPEQDMVLKRYGPWMAVQQGVAQIGKSFLLTFYVLGKLFTGDLSIKTLGGPILIAKMTGDAARIGLASLLSFMAFLSLQLGILNLLPIPVLDGGYIAIALIEMVIRRPIPHKVLVPILTVFTALFILLFALIFLVYPLEKYLLGKKIYLTIIIICATPMPFIIRILEINAYTFKPET